MSRSILLDLSFYFSDTLSWRTHGCCVSHVGFIELLVVSPARNCPVKGSKSAECIYSSNVPSKRSLVGPSVTVIFVRMQRASGRMARLPYI